MKPMPSGSMKYDKVEAGQPAQLATFGAGCYWGTEKYFVQNFSKRDALQGYAVGFMSEDPSAVQHPSYQLVCTGQTGHVEVFHMRFDPTKASFEDLVRHFFTFHDPTTLNHQENDRGTQYASVIFCHTDDQKAVAEKVIAEVQALLDQGKIKTYRNKKVVTKVCGAQAFYPAQKNHQEYLLKQPNGYCNHRKRFQWEKV